MQLLLYVITMQKIHCLCHMITSLNDIIIQLISVIGNAVIYGLSTATETLTAQVHS